MLWYKAWLETRSRFIVALVGCVVFCAMWVIEFGKGITIASRGAAGSLGLLHIVHGFLAFLWILAATFLMMGGLLQEKAVGASFFTLALPVSRARLMLVRAGVGFMQAVALAVVPWMGMIAVAVVAGRPYSLSQASLHIFLLLSGGVFFLVLALLVSSFVEGQYTAPIVSIGASGVLVYLLGSKTFAPLNPWEFMLGSKYFQWHTGLLSGPVPFLHATVFVAAAALLFIVSVKRIQRHDF